MSRVIVYLRVSTDKQECANQRYEADNFCKKRGFMVDEYIEEIVSGTIKYKDRKMGTVLNSLMKDDLLIVSEISRLSRSLYQVMEMLKMCLEKGVRIMTIKEGFVLGDDINSKILAFAFGIAAEIERNMISARTKEGLARRKSEGAVLGRPLGSKADKKLLDDKEQEIRLYIGKKLSYAAIARLLNCHRATVTTFCFEKGITEIKEPYFNHPSSVDYSSIDCNEVLAKYKSTKSFADVAKAYKISPTTLREYLKKNGFIPQLEELDQQLRTKYSQSKISKTQLQNQ